MSSQLSIARMHDPPWNRLDQLPDRTIGQSREWLHFISATQDAEPVVAVIRHGDQAVGWFTGLMVRKFGFRILGSPFPGWTTSYMGFNLSEGVDRGDVMEALFEFAFRDLGCVHVELMDRHIPLDLVRSRRIAHRVFRGYEIDLTQNENSLFSNMDSSCQRCIRKAEKTGVAIQLSTDADFAADYYNQLRGVFARQRLVPTYPIERVESLIRHLSPSGRLLLLRARDADNRCIATGIFPAFNDTMYFWGGASRREYQHLRPNESIHWFAMRYWKERGIAKYDMGGGGEYKKKYGGAEIAVPWVRKSRNTFFPILRELARMMHTMRQHIRGLRTLTR
ncbi:MAG: GNAT family N-acetyltransferase [candidate division Zixibacteria bacterium]|nr:GNAT family N-acetyltransferase [candidate division Zixibacteria bacterium]